MNEDRQVANFDRLLGSLEGLPDVIHTRPATVSVHQVLIGGETYIIQTYRQRDKGDTVFVQRVSAEDTVRIALPPQVADVIARQRESLTNQSRSRAAKAVAAERRAAGWKPSFGPRKGGPRRRKTRKAPKAAE